MTIRDQKPKSNRAGQIIAIVFLLGGLSFLLFAGNLIYMGISSKTWPKTTGRIIRSELERRERVKVAVIRYVYHVNGRDFESDRILFGPMGGAEYETPPVSWFTRRFPENSIQWVFYNPSRPSESALLPGMTRGAKSMAGIGLLFFFAGLFLRVRLKSQPLTPPPRNDMKDGPRSLSERILGLTVFLTFVLAFGYIFFWPAMADWLDEKGVISQTDYETSLVGRTLSPLKTTGAGHLSEKAGKSDGTPSPRASGPKFDARSADGR